MVFSLEYCLARLVYPLSLKDYGWSRSETSTILSSFFWGYVVMLAPAGWVADRFDAKNLFSASLILSGILTMLTEVAADTGGVVLVCYWLPAAALVALSFISVEDPTAAVILLTVSVGFNGMTIMGFQINLIDIAPNFSGLMMGTTGCIGTLMSVAAPLYVGAIVNENTIQEWGTVFLSAAGVYFVGNLIFVIFTKGEVQPWNDPNYSKEKKTGKSFSQLKDNVGKNHDRKMLCSADIPNAFDNV
ncbi:sialin-like [Schistocerca americana]|uniref:sialin-like n=1 Tax=Schistocerca americana TaxID=7009 RepID=UPI001F4F57A6|nr:sialin-like [Schistocerca americana]